MTLLGFDDVLGSELRALGDTLEWPLTPPIAAAVRAQVAAESW